MEKGIRDGMVQHREGQTVEEIASSMDSNIPKRTRDMTVDHQSANMSVFAFNHTILLRGISRRGFMEKTSLANFGKTSLATYVNSLNKHN